MQKKSKKIRIITPTNIVFVLIMTTMIVTAFSISKYQSFISIISKTNVAKWDNQLELIDSESLTLENKKANVKSCKFKVTSDSEVTSKYDITIKNMPNEISVELDDNTYTTNTETIDENKRNIIFKDVGKLAKGEKQEEHILTFKTDADELPSISEVELFATFEQVD